MCLSSLFQYFKHSLSCINRRFCICHCYNSCKASPCGSPCSAFYIFFVFKTRFSKVNMYIHKSRSGTKPCAVIYLKSLTIGPCHKCCVKIEVFIYLSYSFLRYQYISYIISSCLRIKKSDIFQHYHKYAFLSNLSGNIISYIDTNKKGDRNAIARNF